MTDSERRPWTFLTNHARVLLVISRNPDIRARDETTSEMHRGQTGQPCDGRACKRRSPADPQSGSDRRGQVSANFVEILVQVADDGFIGVEHGKDVDEAE